MIKHTLQEIADFFGCWVAVDENSPLIYGYRSEPRVSRSPDNTFYGNLIGSVCNADFISDLPEDWKDSLTAPSELPFKEGEIVINVVLGRDGAISRWNDCKVAEHWRRPTEAEWKVLRGEE